MNNQVFVPVTDDMVYNHPELIEGPLVPYDVGMECQNWLSIEINPDETEPLCSAPMRGESKKAPQIKLAYSA